MTRRRHDDDPRIDGVLVVDKPEGPTSFDVIRSLKRALGCRRVGHTGTLDPMASGVLVVCVGWSTRLVPFLGEGRKVYEGEITLGTTTDTDDRLGCVVATVQGVLSVTDTELERAVARVSSSRLQLPPRYSAIKVGGVRSYAAARAGDELDLAPREAVIHRFDIVDRTDEHVRFVADVSKGTYIRSLARDIGDALGCGAHLSALRRVVNAPFDVSEAIDPNQVDGPSVLLNPFDALRSLPALFVTDEEAQSLRHGKVLSVDQGFEGVEWVRVGIEGSPAELVAVCEPIEGPAGPGLRPARVRPVARFEP